MPEARETTPPQEVKKEGTPPEQAEKPKKETIAEALKTEPKAETVGLDKFLDNKRELKQANARVKELEDAIKDGATKVEITDDINAIAEEFDIDKNFLAKLAKSLSVKAKREAEEEISSKLKPLEERERSEKLDKAFKKHFKAAMEDMPEYADIVNENVIKAMTMQPENADKTFADIIEETYGGAIRGKRTAETTTPRGGKEPAPLDFAKARKDNAYFKEVMSDPKLKAEYNAEMLKKGF